MKTKAIVFSDEDFQKIQEASQIDKRSSSSFIRKASLQYAKNICEAEI